MPSDAAALASFAARTFAETFGDANTSENLALHLSSRYGVEQQTRELTDPRYVTLLMDVDGTIAGYVQLREGEVPPCVIGRDPVEIYRFYIDSAWHGQGLAQRLMTAAKDAAREMGAHSIWLAVWESNPRAIAFYEKSGFRDVGETSFVLGTDVQTDRVMMTELG
ncbi:MAG TPA: GNAT family N-acetyltransferase [Gemmatimonadaceae bacterium]|nr:GNAT family N-acetyltransferase [Gemmatimonadaceae bacterium]